MKVLVASDELTGAGRPGGNKSSQLSEGKEFILGLCLRTTTKRVVNVSS